MTASASFAPPQGIRSPKVRFLHDHWDRLRGARIAPRWAEIDPGALRPILPFLIVTEFLDRPFDVRFRLVGTAVLEAYGEDFMGRTLSTLEATGGHDLWFDIYRRIMNDARPHYGRYCLEGAAAEIMITDVGMFPLSSDGRAVDRTIEVEDWGEALTQSPRILMHHDWRFESL